MAINLSCTHIINPLKTIIEVIIFTVWTGKPGQFKICGGNYFENSEINYLRL